MSKLKWDQVGERFYETGLDHGVLYPIDNGIYPKGVAWNGLTSVNESPSGAEASPLYADNIKYLNLISAEDFGATVEAYTYPPEFEECDGSAEIAIGVSIGQQKRKMFGLAYRTKIGNDTDGQDHGYKLHLIYGATASPSERSRQTVNDSPEAITFSWELNTTPVEVTGFNPAAHLTIDSTKVDPRKLRLLEEILFGSDDEDARLPMPDEIISFMAEPLPTEVTVTAGAKSDSGYYTKSASDLQENITITNNKISGKLKYVDNFEGFSKVEADQKGNYLVLDFSSTNDGEITVEIINGFSGPKKVEDGFCVFKIVDPKKQKIKVTVSKDKYSETIIYDLSGLTLDPAT